MNVRLLSLFAYDLVERNNLEFSPGSSQALLRGTIIFHSRYLCAFNASLFLKTFIRRNPEILAGCIIIFSFFSRSFSSRKFDKQD